MNVKELSSSPDGGKSIEIKCGHISYSGLLRALSSFPSVEVITAKHNVMTDDTLIVFKFRSHEFQVTAPFSDYLVSTSPTCPPAIWSEFVELCRARKKRFWETIV